MLYNIHTFTCEAVQVFSQFRYRVFLQVLTTHFLHLSGEDGEASLQ